MVGDLVDGTTPGHAAPPPECQVAQCRRRNDGSLCSDVPAVPSPSTLVQGKETGSELQIKDSAIEKCVMHGLSARSWQPRILITLARQQTMVLAC